AGRPDSESQATGVAPASSNSPASKLPKMLMARLLQEHLAHLAPPAFLLADGRPPRRRLPYTQTPSPWRGRIGVGVGVERPFVVAIMKGEVYALLVPSSVSIPLLGPAADSAAAGLSRSRRGEARPHRRQAGRS